jgi:hypothetical protein
VQQLAGGLHEKAGFTERSLPARKRPFVVSGFTYRNSFDFVGLHRSPAPSPAGWSKASKSRNAMMTRRPTRLAGSFPSAISLSMVERERDV